MYELAKLCEKIHMPREVTEILLAGSSDDALGFATLRTHLLAACEAWDTYQSLGLSEEIYIDTMAAFSRFVREHMASFGCYGFDRDFWTTRQTGCILFRIGTLEYELLEEDGVKAVSLHIPSDADLSLYALRASYCRAKALLEDLFPDFRGLPWICHSWLLSPELQALLLPGAKILNFQRGFAITPAEDDGEFKQWVYGREDIPNEALPENTSLQRNLKNFLLSGNSFHSGRGILKEDPFMD